MTPDQQHVRRLELALPVPYWADDTFTTVPDELYFPGYRTIELADDFQNRYTQLNFWCMLCDYWKHCLQQPQVHPQTMLTVVAYLTAIEQEACDISLSKWSPTQRDREHYYLPQYYPEHVQRLFVNAIHKPLLPERFNLKTYKGPVKLSSVNFS